MSIVGKRIRDKRVERGLSVDELAARLGKNRATIYRYEKEDIENMPLGIISPLANVLGVSPAYLMGWTDDPSREPSATVTLAPDESALVATYRALNPTGQEVLRTTAQSLALNPDMAAQAPGAAQSAPSLQSAQSPPADRPA